jgi:hypothetical protein
LYPEKSICQDCNCYILNGGIEFNSLRVKKKDLQAMIAIYVLEKNSMKREVTRIPLQIGILRFGPLIIPKHVNDSLICLEIATNNEDILACPCPLQHFEPEEFSSKDGRFLSRPPLQLINFFLCDRDRNSLMVIGNSNIKIAPEISAGAYQLIYALDLDKTTSQKYVTTMSLAKAHLKAKDYDKQDSVYTAMIKDIDIDGLTADQQLKYWSYNYDNKLLLHGADTLKSPQEKKRFNSNYGNTVISDSLYLEKWKSYAIEIKNSEFGKAKLQSLNVDSFNTPKAITAQKNIISKSLGRNEKF